MMVSALKKASQSERQDKAADRREKTSGMLDNTICFSSMESFAISGDEFCVSMVVMCVLWRVGKSEGE